ncbi:class I SAM-dependent methyltransferase [Propionivibrio sp.]|uniref:class I SAM-dependent methyltransferase n=1 Tax=Propionivibrio sp. TaxID=2212460 RepID=UPI002638D666|nr:class I SAM-dependent methyltransferase [Propionivibrio sp.]
MDDTDEAKAYREAAERFALSAMHVFFALHITRTIQGRRKVLDLACGSGGVLAIVAQLNPEIEFIGVDLSEKMLEEAEGHIRPLGLTNVRLVKGDICRLDFPEAKGADGFLCTFSMHHLPGIEILRGLFLAVRQNLPPQGAIFFGDLCHLKSERSIRFIAETENRGAPGVYLEDSLNSLRAAYFRDDIEALRREFLPETKLHTTFPARFLYVLKTKSVALPPSAQRAIAREYDHLSLANQAVFQKIQWLFRLGGLW